MYRSTATKGRKQLKASLAVLNGEDKTSGLLHPSTPALHLRTQAAIINWANAQSNAATSLSAAPLWQRPVVNEAAPATPTPASDAIARQIIVALQASYNGNAILKHPDRNFTAKKVFEFFYQTKMPRDFYRDHAHFGAKILRELGCKAQPLANSYYESQTNVPVYLATGSDR